MDGKDLLVNENKNTGIINYNAINYSIIEFIPSFTQEILDIGCGTGDLAKHLNNRYNFDGITYSIEEAKIAKNSLRNIWTLDLNNFQHEKIGSHTYDCIVASHILEHIYEPWKLVGELQKALKPKGIIIIAVPNVLFYKQRLVFLKGKFKYSLNGGIMDITHYRFFDWNNADILLNNCKLTLKKKTGTGIFPLGKLRKLNLSFINKFENFIIRKFPNLFNYQTIIILEKN